MAPGEITGLVLAGGRGSRMGGIDKGLQDFQGTPLALHALRRLERQDGGLIGPLLISANRNTDAYAAFGARVCLDPLEDFAGPLAGFLAGLVGSETPYLLTVPCDSPRFPTSLALRLARGMFSENADVAMASAIDSDGTLRPQPVFCLMKTTLRASLATYLSDGGRQAAHWARQQRHVLVPFNHPSDDPLAFSNANTLDELRSLETTSPPSSHEVH